MLVVLKRIAVFLGIAISALAIYSCFRSQLFSSGEFSRSVFWYYVAGGLPVLSLTSIVLFRRDKTKAMVGEWRVPEVMLLNVAALGGWPGAWWSIRRFRHKSSKGSFLAGFVGAVVCHLVLLGIAIDWIFWRAA